MIDPAELALGPANVTVGSALLLENDRVRVWDITLAPGERLPFHCHRTTYFYRCETGGAWRVRAADGDEVHGIDEPGQVTFHHLGPGETLVHDLTNTGSEPLRYTTVELLDR